MTSSKHKSISSRIKSLSEAQQLLLAEKLGLVPTTDEADALRAFVVTRPGTNADSLRIAIKENLPGYMQPDVVLVDDLPRTPNGKVDRRELLRIGFKHPEPSRPGGQGPSQIQQKLIDIWQNVLGVENVQIDDNFFELGGDSIRAMQVISRARNEGIQLSVRQLFDQPTIAAISPEKATIAEFTEDDPVIGEVILSPIQQWFFQEDFAERNHWNQSALISLAEQDSSEVVKEALEKLAMHHEALRIYFAEEGDQVWQIIAEEPIVNITIHQYSSSTELDEIVKRAQTELDLSKPGGAWKAIYFKHKESADNRLLLAFHHLLIDGVSWSVLLEDLAHCLKDLRSGAKTSLPPRSVTLPVWHEALQRMANKREIFEQVTHWLSKSSNSDGKIALSESADLVKNTEGNIRKVVLEMTEEETLHLQRDSKTTFRSSLNEILLATLFHTLRQWTEKDNFRLNMEGHGREEGFGKDASRAIGWFTSFFPLNVVLNEDKLPAAIAAVKQALAELPQSGLAISAAQYLSRSETLRNAIHESMKNDVLYNYLGTLNAEYGTGMDYQLVSSRSPLAHRSHLLEVTAYILNSRLQLQWDFCPDLHDPSTIENLANSQLASLKGLLKGDLQNEAHFTHADFPLAALDAKSFETVGRLLTEIDAGEELL